MIPAIHSLIERRVSTTHYRPGATVPDAVLEELVRLATLAPSAYHLQNWHFVVVRSAEGKARLRALAFDQAQVTDAAATVIVCGTLAAHDGLREALQPSLDAGLLPPDTVDAWVAQARSVHEGHAGVQRDEAMRSASLAAMTLILAAEGMGLATGPLGGFDAAGVSEAFGLPPTRIPVLLVTIGLAARQRPRKPRRPLADVLRLA